MRQNYKKIFLQLLKRLENIPKLGIFFAIKIYRYTLSPLFVVLGYQCRFTPSCSEYAMEAFRSQNIFRAMHTSMSRIMRCQPWCEGGFDPVDKSKLGYKGH